jgi:hypothetical protein
MCPRRGAEEEGETRRGRRLAALTSARGPVTSSATPSANSSTLSTNSALGAQTPHRRRWPSSSSGGITRTHPPPPRAQQRQSLPPPPPPVTVRAGGGCGLSDRVRVVLQAAGEGWRSRARTAATSCTAPYAPCVYGRWEDRGMPGRLVSGSGCVRACCCVLQSEPSRSPSVLQHVSGAQGHHPSQKLRGGSVRGSQRSEGDRLGSPDCRLLRRHSHGHSQQCLSCRVTHETSESA